MDNQTIKTLIINDVTGYGRVSTFAMLPIMTHYSLHPYILPTALVSNTMDYGDCEILDTTDFIQNTILKWRKFKFNFDAIITGFINSKEQAELLLSFIKEEKPKFLLSDPIMADSGELYPNMNPDSPKYYRDIVGISDFCVPNLTEARFLAEMKNEKDYVDDEELSKIIETLQDIGCKSIVITDCKDIDNNTFNLLFDNNTSKIKKIYFDKLERSFIGTGDVFSAVLSSEILKGSNLELAVQKASNFVSRVITDNSNNKDNYDLIIENSLKYI